MLLPVCSQAQNFGGNPSGIKWKQINNKNARVIFPAGLDSQANRIHNIVELLDSTTSYSIGGKKRKWNIILSAQTTISNAYVRLAPVMSELYMTPNQDNFSEGSLRWDDNLIIHENRHMQQLANFNHGLTKVFSFFLGQEGQLLANGMVIPDYFFEGDAVWQETLVSTQGRGRFPNFYNGFKALKLDNKKYSWMKLRSGSYIDYTPDHYRLGYQLVAYGYSVYGDDFWRKVTQDAVKFKGVFYSFNRAIEKYSGKSYRQFRKDALEFFDQQSFPAGIKKQDDHFITAIQKNNVVDYLFPVYISDDSILVTKKSYNLLNEFCLLVNGKEKKIRIKNTVLDDYYSYNHGKIVYASYQSDPRWANRDYSVLQLLDIKTGRQKQLSFKSKYFSPDINASGTEIIAVQVNPDGTNYLHRLNAQTGAIILQVPNPENYFFTQTKYLDANTAVSIVRNPAGKMALVKVNLHTGVIENITAFTFNVIGYPFIKGDTVYFSGMNKFSDKIFAVSLSTKKIRRLTDNNNGIYYPVVNSKGEMLVAVFTSGGSRLATINLKETVSEEISDIEFNQVADIYTATALKGKYAGILNTLQTKKMPANNFPKSFRLFNFHSRRPVIGDPEVGYSFYNDNVLSNFSNSLTYTYNRNEKSHGFRFEGVYAGWFPQLSLSAEEIFNRVVDTAFGKSFTFNSSKVNAGVSIPLRFTGGRTSKYFNVGASYNLEQFNFPAGIKDQSIDYTNLFLSFSNISGQAQQHVNPRWAQTFSAAYRYAFSLSKSRKFVSTANFYFPGLSRNHSLLLQAAFQKRDTLNDLFSNSFPYSRGYSALSTRRMYKLGINYQLPLLYPDIGVGNIIFFQRIRGNAFYDYTNAQARFGASRPLTEILNRSAGTEIYFDTKLWNSLPFSFSVRYARLFDAGAHNSKGANNWAFTIFTFVPQ